jgi:outer membrane lipoprotein SlyB
MGWLPNSSGANPAAREAQPVAVVAAEPRVAAKPVVYRQPKSEPKRTVPVLACQSCGTVESVREINTPGDSNGMGAAGGAVVGGLLGNQVGGGSGKKAMTVVGAIGGAIAGNQIERRAKSTLSYETTIHMNNGSRRTVAQAMQPAWREGDRVKIVDGVVRMNG